MFTILIVSPDARARLSLGDIGTRGKMAIMHSRVFILTLHCYSELKHPTTRPGRLIECCICAGKAVAAVVPPVPAGPHNRYQGYVFVPPADFTTFPNTSAHVFRIQISHVSGPAVSSVICRTVEHSGWVLRDKRKPPGRLPGWVFRVDFTRKCMVSRIPTTAEP